VDKNLKRKGNCHEMEERSLTVRERIAAALVITFYMIYLIIEHVGIKNKHAGNNSCIVS
jgi:hypothetical protein